MKSKKSFEYEKILVGYDGRPSSRQALKRALHIAKGRKTEITVFRVLHKEVEIAEPLSSEELEEVKRNYLDKLKREVERIVRREKVKGVRVNYDVEVGDPPEEILKYAEERGYDLIVVGRRNLGRFERFLIGSISSKIVNYAKNVDVLVVEPREE